jgi:hypothetical protein
MQEDTSLLLCTAWRLHYVLRQAATCSVDLCQRVLYDAAMIRGWLKRTVSPYYAFKRTTNKIAS